MTRSRADQFALSGSDFFHCYSRCVRQNFLCGTDEYTGHNYEHRKGWIVERLKKLSSIFAVRLWSYAVMSNHYHIVVEVKSEVAQDWSDEEVLHRWSQVYPRDAKQASGLGGLAQTARIDAIRQSLGDLSKYMSCLNHYISVKANKEEDKKGRFWDSRFKMKNLADEAAVMTAMTYVDLNPIRAKIAKIPEDSHHTSIKERVTTIRQAVEKAQLKRPLQPIVAESILNLEESPIGATIKQYIELVDVTGRDIKENKGAIDKEAPQVLQRLKVSPNGWRKAMHTFNTVTGYVICHAESISEMITGGRRSRFRSKGFSKSLSM